MQKKKKFLNYKKYDSKIYFVCHLESEFVKTIIKNHATFNLTINKDFSDRLKLNGVCLLGKIKIAKKKFAKVYIDNNQPLNGVMMARVGKQTIYSPYLNIQTQKATSYGTQYSL